MKASKGSAFEREICKKLSKWWTGGERDDIFWRSAQSGGRATQRAKSGRRTFGSYGDIAAVDPIGQPLLEAFTIELKRGSTYKTPGDLLDFGPENSKHHWVKCLEQTISSHRLAGSLGWMLICRRDWRETVVCLDLKTAKQLDIHRRLVGCSTATFRLVIQGIGRVSFLCLPFDQFLSLEPERIIRLTRLKTPQQLTN